MSQFVDKTHGVVICSWYDNRRGKEPIDEAIRYDKGQKVMINVDRPASVEIYNKFMGGVDKADMYLALYRTRLRTRKWYHRIAFHVISLAVINAHIIYREVGGQGALLDFLIDICRCWLASQESGSDSSDEMVVADPILIVSQNQFDKKNHWPLQCEKPQRWGPGRERRTRFLCS